MSEKTMEWLDYDKVNKFLFQIYNKTKGQKYGNLRKTLNGDDWLITDGYLAFRVPDGKLVIRPSLIDDASKEVDKTIREIFSFDPKSQHIAWTPRCVLGHKDTKIQRFYVAEDKSFAVLLPEDQLNQLNNRGYLSLFSAGSFAPVKLIDPRRTAVWAILLPRRYNDNDAAAIIPPVI